MEMKMQMIIKKSEAFNEDCSWDFVTTDEALDPGMLNLLMNENYPKMDLYWNYKDHKYLYATNIRNRDMSDIDVALPGLFFINDNPITLYCGDRNIIFIDSNKYYPISEDEQKEFINKVIEIIEKRYPVVKEKYMRFMLTHRTYDFVDFMDRKIDNLEIDEFVYNGSIENNECIVSVDYKDLNHQYIPLRSLMEGSANILMGYLVAKGIYTLFDTLVVHHGNVTRKYKVEVKNQKSQLTLLSTSITKSEYISLSEYSEGFYTDMVVVMNSNNHVYYRFDRKCEKYKYMIKTYCETKLWPDELKAYMIEWVNTPDRYIKHTYQFG